MSDPYDRAKGGRLAFKGGVLATRAAKSSIDKKQKKKRKKQQHNQDQDVDVDVDVDIGGGRIEKEEEEEGIYTIDAAKRRKYDELFPVEAKKFGYDPKSAASNSKSVEEALDDRVKKKADRYCK